MDLIKTYGNYIKSSIKSNKPASARNSIKLGMSLEKLRTKYFPYSKASPSIRILNRICVEFMLEPFKKSENYAWVNLFAPTEILHAMDISPMAIESFSSFASGLNCEDAFIDYAENSGISETLCGYHKAFIGAVESNTLPKPLFSFTSSLICDANINTFRYVSKKYDVPCITLDIPYKYSSEAEDYVVHQLKSAVEIMENCCSKTLKEEKLKEVLIRENTSREYMKKYMDSLKYTYIPMTMTLQMYMLFTSHIFIGRQETLDFYKSLLGDIKNYPVKRGLKVLWVHVMPFYNETLKEYFNFNEKYQIVTCDMPFDNMEYMDFNNPYEALAKKMLVNKLNGSFERRIELIMDIAERTEPDAVITFCHWGCRELSGGVMLLKNALNAKNIPFLSIDGDGVDRRNSTDGQLRTRLQAFFEIINNSKYSN